MYIQPATPPPGFSAFSDWISEMFSLWSSRWQVWVTQGLILISVFIPAIISYIIMAVSLISETAAHPHGRVPPPVTEMLMTYGLMLLGSLIVSFLIPGMIITALKQMRGEKITVGDMFSGMRFFWVNILLGLIVGLGVIGCYFGAFVLQAFLYLALPIYIDKRGTSLGEAMSLSWNTVAKNFWFYLVYIFVTGIIAGLGFMACYIGYFVTVPFMMIAQAVAYERTFNPRTAFGGAQPIMTVPPPPPYMPVQPAPDVQANVVNTRECANCGVRVEGEGQFCPLCGKPL